MSPRAVKNQKGFSFINILVGITIIIIAGLGIWNLFNFSLRIVTENKSRTVAMAIANEKIEIIRNLPYDDIGTIDGVVSGAIPQNEGIVRNGTEFQITTKVFYIDDPYDNVVPLDLLGADYKKIKISVDWPRRIYGDPVTFYSFVNPKGVETDLEGGTIRIIVFNASGQPIPNALVEIINNTLDPPIDDSSVTDQSGILLIPGSPATDDRSYEIIVSKEGYTTEKTYPEPGGEEAVKPHLQVLEDQIAEKSFTIDLTSTFNITTIGKESPINWRINVASTFAEQIASDVSVDDSNFYYFVWQDDKDTGSYRIYAQKYSDAGIVQWDPDLRISNAINQINPRIESNGTSIYIVWNDDRWGNQDSYLFKLDTDGTKIWDGDKKMGSLESDKDQTFPDVAIQESNNYSFITFQENSGTSDDWDIYAHSYDSNGNANWANAIKINDDSSASDQQYPIITYYNDTLNDDKVVHIVWQDERNTNWDIYAQKLNATGTPLWANNIKINTDLGTTNQTAPAIDVDSNGNLYIVWQDFRNSNWDIYMHKYNSDGSAVWANEFKIDQTSDNSNQTEPAIAIDSTNQIYVSWTDDRFPVTQGEDIYAQKFDSNGTSLWPTDEQITYNDETNSDQWDSSIAVDNNDYAVFVWQDERDEDTDIDIFSARYKTPGVITNLPNIPINIKGTKLIYNTPATLKHDNNYTTDTNGQLTLIDIEWDSYTIEPQSTSTYVLISSDPPQPTIINPDETVNIELNIE